MGGGLQHKDRNSKFEFVSSFVFSASSLYVSIRYGFPNLALFARGKLLFSSMAIFTFVDWSLFFNRAFVKKFIFSMEKISD